MTVGGSRIHQNEREFTMKKTIMVGALFGAVMLLVTGASSTARFGTYCQEEFQNHWKTELHYSWEHCSRFNNELDDTDTKVFYRNLHSARDEFETDNDQNGIERVHLAYIKSHGWYSSTAGRWTMWNDGVRAYTNNMWLGNENHKTSILASYACGTHHRADGNLWARWNRPFKGGLRISLGSHHTLWDGPTTDECGEDFADDLQGGMRIRNAWKSALSDWWVDQDVIVLATGEFTSQCRQRRDNMKWQTYTDYPRKRGNDVHVICWVYWSNL